MPEDRGQYLAHCASCHSPRMAFMAQDGITAADPDFLIGGVVDGWDAPALCGPHSVPQKGCVGQIATFLLQSRGKDAAPVTGAAVPWLCDAPTH